MAGLHGCTEVISTGIDIQGNLSQSLLRNMYNEVAAGIVQPYLNVPCGQLLGQDSREDSYSNDVSGETCMASSHQESQKFHHVPEAMIQVSYSDVCGDHGGP
jgi:hypothetical protein